MYYDRNLENTRKYHRILGKNNKHHAFNAKFNVAMAYKILLSKY
jgi:hypothetical protein